MADGPEIVVIGGGYAGLTAAARLGEAAPDARTTLIDAKPGFVERIRLHEVATGSTPTDYPYAPFLDARGVAFVQGRVTALDPGSRRLSVARSDGGTADVGYDRLIYALGSRTDRDIVPGAADHALALDNLDSAREIHRRATDAAASRGRVLVVGGGLTGIEAACEVAERLPALHVTIAVGVTFAPSTDAGGLSPDGIDHVRRVLRGLGVETVVGSRVARLDRGAARLDDGCSVPFDLCVWAAGFRAPALARESGIDVNARDQIVTDAALRSVSHPDIIAIGDAAEVAAAPAGPCRMSCATGRPMGDAAARTVANVLVGKDPPRFDFAYAFRCISLGRTDGLIQFVDQHDAPVRETWRGERGARWKEYICRRTLQGIGLVGDLGTPPDRPPETRTSL